jgi:hypothetical protein
MPQDSKSGFDRRKFVLLPYKGLIRNRHWQCPGRYHTKASQQPVTAVGGGARSIAAELVRSQGAFHGALTVTGAPMFDAVVRQLRSSSALHAMKQLANRDG